MMVDETLSTLSVGNLQLLQAKSGYRYSLDPILLARFVRKSHWGRVVDLGTGCGILPLLLAELSDADELIGIELQAGLAERAQRNVNLNSMQERVFIHQADIRAIEETLPANCADLVVCNPPYRALGSGRIAPDDERAAARHELAGGLKDFIVATSWLLNNGGTFAMVHLVERLPALFDAMLAKGIEPKRLRMVHPRHGEDARLVLVEGRKGGRPGLQVEPPLYIYKEQGRGREYTDEILRMYEPDLI